MSVQRLEHACAQLTLMYGYQKESLPSFFSYIRYSARQASSDSLPAVSSSAERGKEQSVCASGAIVETEQSELLACDMEGLSTEDHPIQDHTTPLNTGHCQLSDTKAVCGS